MRPFSLDDEVLHSRRFRSVLVSNTGNRLDGQERIGWPSLEVVRRSSPPYWCWIVGFVSSPQPTGLPPPLSLPFRLLAHSRSIAIDFHSSRRLLNSHQLSIARKRSALRKVTKLNRPKVLPSPRTYSSAVGTSRHWNLTFPQWIIEAFRINFTNRQNV
jgi:hypothetical protein